MANLTFSDSKENLLSKLKSRMDISATNKDSSIAILAEIIGSEIETVKDEIYEKFHNNQIENLSDEVLEQKAFNLYGIRRIPPTRASSNKFSFYTDASTNFGGINDGIAITVPSGTKISVSSNVEDESIVFIITEEVFLEAEMGYARFYAEALGTGSNYNVGRNTLKYCDFKTYSDYNLGSLKVLNEEDISNGSEEENDSSLRIRAINFLSENSNKNKESLFLSGLRESSVFQFEIIESYFGIGTIALIVKGHGLSQVSEVDLNRIRNRVIPSIKVLGQSVFVERAKDVTINLILTGSFGNTRLAENEKELEKTSIKKFIRETLKINEYENSINFKVLSETLISDFNLIKPISGSNSLIFSNIEVSISDREVGGSSTSDYTNLNTLDLNLDESLVSIMIDTDSLS
jgi:hypothetical protein